MVARPRTEAREKRAPATSAVPLTKSGLLAKAYCEAFLQATSAPCTGDNAWQCPTIVPTEKEEDIVPAAWWSSFLYDQNPP